MAFLTWHGLRPLTQTCFALSQCSLHLLCALRTWAVCARMKHSFSNQGPTRCRIIFSSKSVSSPWQAKYFCAWIPWYRQKFATMRRPSMAAWGTWCLMESSCFYSMSSPCFWCWFRGSPGAILFTYCPAIPTTNSDSLSSSCRYFECLRRPRQLRPPHLTYRRSRLLYGATLLL